MVILTGYHIKEVNSMSIISMMVVGLASVVIIIFIMVRLLKIKVDAPVNRKVVFWVLSIAVILLTSFITLSIQERTVQRERVNAKAEEVRIIELEKGLNKDNKNQFLTEAVKYFSSVDKNIYGAQVRATWIRALLDGVDKEVLQIEDVKLVLAKSSSSEAYLICRVIEYYELKYGNKGKPLQDK